MAVFDALSPKATEVLVQLYRDAYTTVLQRISEFRSRGRSTLFDEGLLRDIGRQLNELDRNAESWARATIPRLYGDGTEEAIRSLLAAGGQAAKMVQAAPNLALVHRHAVEVLVQSATDDLQDATRYVGRRIRDAWQQAQLTAALEKTVQGQTIKEAQKALKTKLADQGLKAFRDASGAEWSLDGYANMVVRSVTAESQTAGTLNQLQGMGYDLVQMTEHRSPCPICAMYEGRVYSISGRDSRYPPLNRVPGFDKGYRLIHPNCRHRISAYIREGDPNADETEAASNRPFVDERTEEDKAAYARSQKQAALRRDRQKLEQQVAVLPDGPEKDAARDKLRAVRAEQTALGKETNAFKAKSSAELRAYYEAQDAGRNPTWPGRSAGGSPPSTPAATPPPAPPTPSPAVPMTPVEWLDKYNDYLGVDMEDRADSLGISVGEYQRQVEAAMNDVLGSGEVCIRAPSDVMGKILDDGRFKTQFETGTSRGFLGPTVRQRTEKSMWGIPDSASPAERPIYGYLQSQLGPQQHDRVRQYGDVLVILKESVRQRSTFTYGDSLDMTAAGSKARVAPSPMVAPSYRSACYSRQNPDVAHSVADLVDQGVPYVEVQVFGGVSVSDIERVVYDAMYRTFPFGRGVTVFRQEVVPRLNALGIPWSEVK